jgi:hypothetical protein
MHSALIALATVLAIAAKTGGGATIRPVAGGGVHYATTAIVHST